MIVTQDEALTILAAQRLMARYTHRVDDGDGDGVAELFAADGLLEIYRPDLAIRCAGRDEIANFFSTRELMKPPRRHHISCIDVAFDDSGTLRAKSYQQTVGLAIDPELGALTCGYYDDEFVPDGDGWLFQSKRIHVEVSALHRIVG